MLTDQPEELARITGYDGHTFVIRDTENHDSVTVTDSSPGGEKTETWVNYPKALASVALRLSDWLEEKY